MIRAAFTQAIGAFLADQLQLRWRNAELEARVRYLEAVWQDDKRRLSKANTTLEFVGKIIKDKTVPPEKLAKRIDDGLNVFIP